MAKNVVVHFQRERQNSAILIGTSLSAAARDIRRRFPDSNLFIITDSHVAPLYGRQFAKQLGVNRAKIIVVPAGEKSKTRAVKERVEDRLLRLHADRQCCVIALGGGMIGDLAGFVASTLFRGVSFIQIPTTLLAQVDSSIGGKVAVDHPLGKNLLGTFYQPCRVYIDVTTLRTLPDRQLRNGIAEVIKYGAILDRDLFSYVDRNEQRILRRDPAVLSAIIVRCLKLKKRIVEQDERESGLRRILNFGHTIGHALELLSDYALLHGEAIALGMLTEAKISVSLCNLHPVDVWRLWIVLRKFGLPTEFPHAISLKKIEETLSYDKKSRNGVPNFTLLKSIGNARVGIPVGLDEITDSIR